MKWETLGKLFKITSGGTPSRNKPEYFANGEIPWVKTGDLGKKYIAEPLEKITQLGLKNSSAKIFPAKTVLVAMYGATIGSCSILAFEACTNQACAAFLPNAKINHEYLYYFLRSVNRQLVALGQGGGQPNISATLLKSVKIPLLALDDQKRIAHLLDRVEGLITRREQHLQQLDDLIKSVFLEMFGDPVRNEKGWEVRPCDKVVTDIKSGTSYGGEEKDSLDADEYGVLKISAVTQGYFNPREFKAVKKSVIRKPLRFVKKGDLLFSRANTIELVAACCVVPEDMDTLFLPDKLWALSLNDQVNIQFFNFLLKNESFRNLIRKQANGGHDSMLNISMKNFRSLSVPVPEEGLQNKFAAIVEKIEGIKSRYQNSLTDLETLYGALSQKAFKGDLDLRRVPLPSITGDLAVELPSIEGEMHGKVETVPYELPDPGDLKILESTEGRKKLLEQWLEAYLDQLGNIPFFAQHFMETAQQKLWDLVEDEAPEWGVVEYDQIKEWVFQSLGNGRLKQSYDDKGNQVLITSTKS